MDILCISEGLYGRKSQMRWLHNNKKKFYLLKASSKICCLRPVIIIIIIIIITTILIYLFIYFGKIAGAETGGDYQL